MKHSAPKLAPEQEFFCREDYLLYIRRERMKAEDRSYRRSMFKLEMVLSAVAVVAIICFVVSNRHGL